MRRLGVAELPDPRAVHRPLPAVAAVVVQPARAGDALGPRATASAGWSGGCTPRPEGRRRVLITSGTPQPHAADRQLDAGPGGRADRGRGRGADRGAGRRRPRSSGTSSATSASAGSRWTWSPPTCDLAVHHGGATTATTLVNAGVPQLVIPDNGYGKAIAQAIAGFGAAITLTARPKSDEDPGRRDRGRLPGDPGQPPLRRAGPGPGRRDRRAADAVGRGADPRDARRRLRPAPFPQSNNCGRAPLCEFLDRRSGALRHNRAGALEKRS